MFVEGHPNELLVRHEATQIGDQLHLMTSLFAARIVDHRVVVEMNQQKKYRVNREMNREANREANLSRVRIGAAVEAVQVIETTGHERTVSQDVENEGRRLSAAITKIPIGLLPIEQYRLLS